jgi:hypothetical protein
MEQNVKHFVDETTTIIPILGEIFTTKPFGLRSISICDFKLDFINQPILKVNPLFVL